MKKQIPLLWILNRTRRRIPAMVLLVLCSAGTAIFSVFFALGSRNIIDAAISGVRRDFLGACLGQGGVILGILLCLTLSRHLTEWLRATLDRDWKQDILHHLLRGDYGSVSQYHSGELINRLNNDVRMVDEGIISALPGMVSMVVRLISAMIALVALEPWFALIISAVGVVAIIATGLMRKKLKGLHKRVNEKDGVVSAFLQEVLEKLLMVQAMDVAPEMEQRTDQLLQERYRMQRKRKNVSLFANTGVSLMTYGAGFVALVWCAFRLLQGAMSFGSLTAVTQLVSQLQAPFTNLSGVLPKYIAMIASAERLMELEQIPPEPAPMEESSQALYQRMDAICGEGLTFAYDRDPVLENADFRVPKGSFAAITGPSGMGKSTLLKLMLGIFQPQAGQMYVSCGEDRVPVTRATRKLFAYVPQGNLLLSGSLRDNLLVANPQATPEQIQEAIYVSAMDQYLSQLPQGLDTVLGENAAGLSEGQAQRLAIARAIISGAPVLLLDESTSALDQQTEYLVLQRIRELPGRTCIAVTHRPAAMELCDFELKIGKNRAKTEENR